MVYDKLIFALQDREKAIEARLRESIDHYGIKERILMQGKDFAKELEDVPNVDEKHIDSVQVNPENIISVGQQVSNVLQSKNVSDEEKVYRLLHSTLNPFNSDSLFNENQMRSTTSRELRPFKVPAVPDPRIPRSLQNLMF